jgi:hypothetical protein
MMNDGEKFNYLAKHLSKYYFALKFCMDGPVVENG